MRLSGELNDAAVLAGIGRRLGRLRLEHNVTQRELATGAGVSLATVQRLEGGRGATLTALVRTLRALDLLEGLEALVAEPAPSSIEPLARAGRQRRRAAGAHSKRRQAQPDARGPAKAPTPSTTPSITPSTTPRTTTSPWATGRVSPQPPESP
jgi:transcriptional regulator with XRE-family HTH domain